MAKQRAPRTRNNGTWTEARYWGFIRSALRSAFQRWGPKHECRKRARVRRGKYRCAVCDGIFSAKDTQVDHIIPAGSLNKYDDLPEFVERMFCEVDGFQLLCKDCHQIKTNQEREERKSD